MQEEAVGEVGRREEVVEEVERGGSCITHRISKGVNPFHPAAIRI